MASPAIVAAVVALVLLLVVDGVWIFANKRSYQVMVERVQRLPMRINPIGAVLSYLFLYLALVFIAFPAIRAALGAAAAPAISARGTPKPTPTASGLLWLSFRHAGVLGLFLYGVFNFTNMAMFANYDVAVAIKDTLWGAVLLTVVSWATFMLIA